MFTTEVRTFEQIWLADDVRALTRVFKTWIDVYGFTPQKVVEKVGRLVDATPQEITETIERCSQWERKNGIVAVSCR